MMVVAICELLSRGSLTRVGLRRRSFLQATLELTGTYLLPGHSYDAD